MIKILAIILFACSCGAADIVLGLGAPASFSGTGTNLVAQWGTPDVLDGLVHWWKLDGNAEDSAGTNNAAITGTPSLDADGKIGKCFLSGGETLLSCGNLGTFNNFTISFWVVSFPAGDYPNPISTHNAGNAGLRFERQGNGPLFSCYPYPSGSGAWINTSFESDRWYFITVANEGDASFKAYCDGILVVDMSGGGALDMPNFTIDAGLPTDSGLER